MPECIICRQYCSHCNVVRTVMRHPDVTELCCPTCGTRTTEARGPDDIRKERV